MKNERLAWYLGGLVVWVFLIWGGILDDFFFRDDYVWLDEAQKTLTHLSNVLNLNISNFFRPVIHLIMAFNLWVFGLNPTGYHTVSLLFHALNGILFFYFLRDALKIESKPILLLAPFVWVTQFAYAEAVAWISGLTTVVLTTWILLTFIGLGRERKGLFYTAFVLILFTKEEGAFVWPLVVLYLYLFEQEPIRKVLTSKKVWITGVLWAAYMFGQYALQHGAALVMEKTFTLDPSIFLRMTEKWLAVFLNLQPAIHMAAPTLVVAILLLLTFALYENDLTRRQSLFLVAFLVLSVIPTSFLHFDTGATRYLYNPSLPASVFLVVLGMRLFRTQKAGPWLAGVLLCAWIATQIFTLRSVQTLFENFGSEGKKVVEQLEPYKEAYAQKTFNLVNPPYAEVAMISLMKVFLEVPKEQIVFNQPMSEDFVNLTWDP